MSLTSSRGVSILCVLGAAAFAGAWNFTFLAPVLPSVAEDAGVSITAAGQLVTASALVTVVSLVLFGPLADRYGKRPMLLTGLGAMALAALGSSITSSYEALMTLRILSGVGDALVLPSAAAAVSDYFREKDREVALNILLVPMGAAVVIGLPVVVLISDALSWHAAFLVFGAFNLAGMLGLVLFLPEPVAPPAARRTLADHYRISYGTLFGKRLTLLVLGAAILSATVWNGMVVYAGAFFEDELGAHGAEVSGLFAALGGAYVVGGVLGIALARRLPSRSIAVWSALAAAALIVPVVTSTEIVPLTVVLAAAFAASRSPGIAALNNMLLDLAPEAEATAISAYGVVAASGALLGAGSGGVALAAEGFVTMAASFTAIALAAAALLLVPLRQAGIAGDQPGQVQFLK